MLKQVLTRGTAIASSAVAILATLTVTSTSASAGDCETPECGGEVSNNSSWKSVLISNCWDDDSKWTQEGHYLDCHSTDPPATSPRVGNVKRAAIALQPGDWSSDHSGKYSRFYDADAIRFPAGCVTTAHFWGHFSYTTDRRGKPPLWGRIQNWDHFYIDGVSC